MRTKWQESPLVQDSLNLSTVCALWRQKTKQGDHPSGRVPRYDLHKTTRHTPSLKEPANINSPLPPGNDMEN